MPTISIRDGVIEGIAPESEAGGWERYTSDWFSREMCIAGHRIILSVYRSGREYHGYVTDANAPIGKSVHFVDGPGDLVQIKRRAVRLAMSLEIRDAGR